MPTPSSVSQPASPRLLPASLAALGIVYGDIGTSPLYALRESFSGHYGIAPNPDNVLGVLSLITWALVLIICIKYLLIVLRADNEGEGGIIALTALLSGTTASSRRLRMVLLSVGLFGAALLFGDGVLTPAISVLSAVEGIEIYAQPLEDWTVPVTVGILLGLFLLQRRGTAGIGAMFGPVSLVWFLVLAALGVKGILLAPQVLDALYPSHAVWFFQHNGLAGYLVLGAVFLVVTGAEALYADLGHFGRRPIRFAWFALVLPALLLNYYGQGALVLWDPAMARSPFYLLAPSWGLVPLILLATAATIIASQAIISGVFSLSLQAVQLGHWPRLRILHTSPTMFGQIYVPAANWALMIATTLLVLVFRSSSALAGAYGIAIVCDMIITTLLLYVVVPSRLGWPPFLARLALTAFLLVELAFFGANFVKIPEGGWVPLAIAAVLFVMTTTWQSGRRLLGDRIRENLRPLDKFLADFDPAGVTRVPGNAIYMTGNQRLVPNVLLQNLKHQKTLHENVFIVTVLNIAAPTVRHSERMTLDSLTHGFHRVVVRYGFMEGPDMMEILALLAERGLVVRVEESTFFLGRERLVAAPGPFLLRWRALLFAFMARNSQRATAYFNIPPDRVVEVGTQVPAVQER